MENCFMKKYSNRVESKTRVQVDSRTKYNYLSIPIFLRVSMGHSPLHWYLNAGPKISLWMSGSGYLEIDGELFRDPLSPDGITRQNYKVVFSRQEGVVNPFLDESSYFVYRANRIQYSLSTGGGFYVDLSNGKRLMFDFRYNWGHSNMGINPESTQQDGTLNFSGELAPDEGYFENYEFRNNTFAFFYRLSVRI